MFSQNYYEIVEAEAKNAGHADSVLLQLRLALISQPSSGPTAQNTVGLSHTPALFPFLNIT